MSFRCLSCSESKIKDGDIAHGKTKHGHTPNKNNKAIVVTRCHICPKITVIKYRREVVVVVGRGAALQPKAVK